MYNVNLHISQVASIKHICRSHYIRSALQSLHSPRIHCIQAERVQAHRKGTGEVAHAKLIFFSHSLIVFINSLNTFILHFRLFRSDTFNPANRIKHFNPEMGSIYNSLRMSCFLSLLFNRQSKIILTYQYISVHVSQMNPLPLRMVESN